jgi:phenol hydroxylase P4 protein
MSVRAITPDYHGEFKDTEEKYHGQRLLGLSWDHSGLYTNPFCIAVAPDMPFADLADQVIPKLFGPHPDFARIDWSTVTWTCGGKPFVPDRAKSLAENGIGHKALLRFAVASPGPFARSLGVAA